MLDQLTTLSNNRSFVTEVQATGMGRRKRHLRSPWAHMLTCGTRRVNYPGDFSLYFRPSTRHLTNKISSDNQGVALGVLPSEQVSGCHACFDRSGNEDQESIMFFAVGFICHSGYNYSVSLFNNSGCVWPKGKTRTVGKKPRASPSVSITFPWFQLQQLYLGDWLLYTNRSDLLILASSSRLGTTH